MLAANNLIITDLRTVMHSYVYGGARLLEWERKFGGFEERVMDNGDVFTIWNSSRVINDWTTHLNSIDPMLREEAINILASYEGRMMYSRSPAVRLTVEAIQTLVNLVLLPLTIFAQFSEIGGIMLRSEKGITDTYLNFHKSIKEIHEEGDMYRLARAFGIITERTTQHAMFDAGETAAVGMDTKARSALMSINEKFFRYNGMEYWAKLNRQMATQFGVEYLDKYSERALRGDQDAIERLGEVHVTAQEVRDWIQQGMPVNYDDPGSARIAHALHQFVDGSVMRPNPMMRPVWMSDPMFGMLSHLKGFFWYFHNTFIRRSVRFLGAKAAKGEDVPWEHFYGWAMMLPLTIMGMAMRDFLFYFGSDREPPERSLYDYVRRSGIAGIATLHADFANSVQHYGLGKAAIDTTAPSLSLASNFFTQNFTTAMSKATPGLSLTYQTRQLIRPSTEADDSEAELLFSGAGRF